MIKSKIEEALKSILPIALIVFALSITLTPISAGYMFIFLVGIGLGKLFHVIPKTHMSFPPAIFAS